MDAFLGACIFPLAILVLISGLDDLVLVIVCALDWWRRRRLGIRLVHPPDRELSAIPEKRLAIFVPCWHESAVIGNMIQHNVAAVGYRNYDFFIGAYPNDEATVQELIRLEARFPNVHQAVCPHDGPTSKADCLNWIYQRMLLFEESRGFRYDAVMTHDAEDLIHPKSLRLVNYHLDGNDMVQIPVLALHTPFRKFTHGLYCDDFAEFQLKDMRARGILGSFIPSNGVGTAYGRRALELLAESAGNRIFEPECLTEDYENGIRLKRLGCRQVFVPISGEPGDLVATREFFPATVAAAIRQRSRWLMGITLQAWQRHGWSGDLIQRYWFWRDRKALAGAPLSLLTNILFVFGAATWLNAKLMGRPWGLPLEHIPPWILTSTLALQAIHMSIRMGCVARIYGWVFALGAPFRVTLGNYINAVAAGRAIYRYALSRVRRAPLVWVKTHHAYPSRIALLAHRRRIGEVLTGSGYLETAQLEAALATQPPGVRLGEHLIGLGLITDEELYEALSLQQSLPSVRLEAAEISQRVARSLPRAVVERWKVLPFRIAARRLFLASPEIPSEEMGRQIGKVTKLSLEFHLVTPGNFDELRRTFL